MPAERTCSQCGAQLPANSPGDRCPNSDGGDTATIKYSGAGVGLWTNRYYGYYANAMAVDGSGNVFVTVSATGGGRDYATIKYSGAGVPLWTNRYNGFGSGPGNEDSPRSLALGPDGSVYVTGVSYRDLTTVQYIYGPRLAIERSAADVIVSWPSAFGDFILQQNTNGIATINWSNVTDDIQDNGTNRTLIINPPPTGSRFYRLFKP